MPYPTMTINAELLTACKSALETLERMPTTRSWGYIVEEKIESLKTVISRAELENRQGASA
jgi:hypothetical protein